MLAPAIDLAENGFLVTPTLYNDMFGSYDAMMAYPEFGDVYLNEDGLNYQVGDTFKNPDLAKTLTTIAEKGSGCVLYGSDGPEDR